MSRKRKIKKEPAVGPAPALAKEIPENQAA
jgi:hypothetical protein